MMNHVLQTIRYQLPLFSCEETAATSAADAAAQHLVNHLLPRHCQYFLQCLKALLCNVLVKVERIQTAITLGGNTHLTAKERVDTLRALLLWNKEDIIPGLIRMEGVNLIEKGISPAAQPTGRTEVMEQNLLHLVGLHVGIANNTAVSRRHINQRNLITGADARHGFQPNIDA